MSTPLFSALLASVLMIGAAAAQAPADGWPAEVNPAAHPAPSQGELLLIGGDLSDGNYGGGQLRSDGGLQHVAGRHFAAGSGWWAMACRAEDCRLLPVSLAVEDRPHPTYDGPMVPGQVLRLVGADAESASFLQRPVGDPDLIGRPRTAQDVVMLAGFGPGVALSALPLQSGPLTTWWYAAPRSGSPDTTAPFAQQLVPPLERQIRISETQLLTLRQQPPDPSADVPAISLELEYAGLRQRLGRRELHIGETAPVELGEVLQWVGDVDGDNRPDLLINHTGYWWDVALWLSSRAQPGELVGEAARFSYAPPDSPGC
jgi:hypothetical protein